MKIFDVYITIRGNDRQRSDPTGFARSSIVDHLAAVLSVGRILKVPARQLILEYLEELLQFHHQLPVRLHQVVAEVLLARVYALPADL